MTTAMSSEFKSDIESVLSEYGQWTADENLTLGLADRPDAAVDAKQLALVKKLCKQYQVLKREQEKQTGPYQVAGEWREYTRSRQAYYDAWLNEDVPAAASNFKNFWRNGLSIVQEYATFDDLQAKPESRARFIDRLAYSYMVWKNLLGADLEELAVPAIGNPWGYFIDDTLVAPKAFRYHVLAKQIGEIVRDQKRPVVAEIGAGYGGAAYFLLRDNPNLTYIDYDLPEVQMLAAYYLSTAFPKRKILFYEPSMKLSASTLKQYSIIFMPPWMLPKTPAGSVDLFYNTFSLSEMAFPTIKEYIAQIGRCCRGYFLHNNMDRQGVVQLGHERTPCSKYPIDPKQFKRLYKRYDLFQRRHAGKNGDYREELFQRI
jgi:putative sugar O-methyltransferase